MSDDGERCTERGFLEYDHREPVALGGLPTTANVRLLCGRHNRYEAERVLGATQARPIRASATAPAASPVVGDGANAAELAADTVRGLCGLGFTVAEARRAVADSAAEPATTLEQRLRAALAAVRAARPTRCAEPIDWLAHWQRVGTA